MRLRFIFSTILIFSFFMNYADAKSPVKKKKFENPALQFEGTWRVEEYDFREFLEAPDDLTVQLKNEAGAFPVGQHIRFEWTGSAGLPGNIDPVTMKFDGPIGETLRITLLQPFEKELCDRKRWHYLCETHPQKEYSAELLIDDIFNWKRDASKESLTVWADMNDLQYSLIHMGKSYHFDAWIAKNGDIVLPIIVDGRKKGGGDAAKIGVRLKRIKD